MRRRFALVVPHLRRALLIRQAIDLKKVEAAARADSLDTLSSGMSWSIQPVASSMPTRAAT